MNENNGAARKPKALAAGSRLGVFAPASPADSVAMIAGLAELKRHGFQVVANQASQGRLRIELPSGIRTGEEPRESQVRDWIQRPHHSADLSVAKVQLGNLLRSNGCRRAQRGSGCTQGLR